MKFKKGSIAKARINNLDKQPYWFGEKSAYCIDITFYSLTTHNFCSHYTIELGATWSIALKNWDKIKSYISKVNINNEAEVVLLYSGKDLIAIGCRNQDCWLDFQKDFIPVKFKDLNLVLTSLIVDF